MCRNGTLQSAECHPCTLAAECHPGTSNSLRKVSCQDFLLVLGSSRPKITNWYFWPSYDQMVLSTSVWLKPGFRHFEVRLRIKFSKFWPGETSDLYANGPESFPPGFFPSFWHPTAGNYESLFLTGVRPKSVLLTIRRGLKNPRLMAG